MSDKSVAAALRSKHRLVAIEAPGGCGKTYQAAEYAHDSAAGIAPGRMLILTHTHGACDVIAARTQSAQGRVEIRTIDSVLGHIASAYHQGLGLPPDAAAWARQKGGDGFQELATKVARLLKDAPSIAWALTQRYPLIVCDEHQDATLEQHGLIQALHDAGASVRIFFDFEQRIFPDRSSKKNPGSNAGPPWRDWLKHADVTEKLGYPHRWMPDSEELGRWILAARETLRDGGQIDLRGKLPAGVRVAFAENHAQAYGRYQTDPKERKPIDAFVQANPKLLILATTNDMARGLRAFFGRRIPIWEGYTRDALDTLIASTRAANGDVQVVGEAMLNFLGKVARGFTPSGDGKILLREISEACVKRRTGKPAALQELARFILDAPDHRGVARALGRLAEQTRAGQILSSVEIDLNRELWEAVKLAEFEDAEAGLAEITQRRTYSRRPPPARAISTVHKAKGLECQSVLVMPCDGAHFTEKADHRRLLYVALSRPTRSLMLVLSRQKPSPLFQL